MAFKLNPNRTYRYPVSVTIYDGDREEKGTFHATFRALGNDALTDEENASKRVLDLVLVGVEGIEVPGPDGQPLADEALLTAVKNDAAVSMALVSAYQESVSKKNRPKGI